jgi:glucokinase
MVHRKRKMSRLRAASSDEVRHATHLRGLNLERILTVAIDRSGPFTRAELTEATGLSAPTVGSLASHLIRRGLVRDLGVGPSRGGRRPVFMEFNARHGFVVGIDLGPRQTRIAIADLSGVPVAQSALPTPQERTPSELLALTSAAVRVLMREAQVSPSRLLAVGASAPGAVDRERGMVLALAPDLEGWSRVPMAAILKRALRAPVVVENNVNLAILGERWRGVARGHDSCAFIWLGTGIGAGIVVNGDLHHGHNYLAGEIAFMCMGLEYVDQDFGARGCLETLAGLKAILTRWSHPSTDADGGIGAIFEAAMRGDRGARNALQETARLIGMAIANLSVVLDPSLIVMGGALATQGPSLVEDVRRVVARIVPTPSPIVMSTLGQEAPLIGSVLMAVTEARRQLRQELRTESAVRPKGRSR